jgi:hypothetical protein
MSKSVINYVPAEHAIQISMHVFLDDFEVALSQYGFDSLQLCTKKESILADSMVHVYLQNHLTLQVHDSIVSLDYVGKEISEDLLGAWIYLEGKNVSQFKKMSIVNKILISPFPDQQNIMSIKSNGQEKYLRLTSEDYSKELIWD